MDIDESQKNTVDEVSICSSSKASPQVVKRRSSIFRRHSNKFEDESFSNETSLELVSDSKRIKIDEKEKDETDCLFNIQEYISNLKKEETSWRDTLLDRKLQYQKKKKEFRTKQSQPLDLSILTDSEKAFLDKRPDYESFNKNIHLLQVLTTRVSFFKSHADKLQQNLIDTLNKETQEIKQRLIGLID